MTTLDSARLRRLLMSDGVIWLGLAAAVTAGMARYRDTIGAGLVPLIYQLIVLGASARAGRRLGFTVAVVCFLLFYYYFVPEYYSFRVHRFADLFVLLAFLAASAVGAHLLQRARSEAAAARARADEVGRLASLGADALHAPRASEAIQSMLEVIASGLRIPICEIHLDLTLFAEPRVFAVGSDTPREPVRRDAELREEPGDASVLGVLDDGRTYVVSRAAVLSEHAVLIPGTRSLIVPLRVRSVRLGTLRLEDPAGIQLDPARMRFADALSHYAALALERYRLAAAAERADALREADRVKDALLASVSHDLRTPLTAIKALARELRDAGSDRGAMIESEADRLNRFVSNLLDLSRLQGGSVPPSLQLVVAEDVLGAALDQTSALAAGRAVEARLNVEEPLLVGRLDYVQTLRALVNLIENALKYSPAEAPVEIQAYRDGEWLVFEVADRGPGIPAAHTERIFEPFFRAGGESLGGTGLGLAISRKAAELQGGSVGYRRRPGGGSVFWLRVPAASPGELAAGAS